MTGMVRVGGIRGALEALRLCAI